MLYFYLLLPAHILHQTKLRLSRSLRERFLRDVQGETEYELSHPLSHPPQRLVFGMEGFECRTPLVVPPLIEPEGHTAAGG